MINIETSGNFWINPINQKCCMKGELNRIFEEWKERMKRNGDGDFFTKDGILRQNNKSDEQIEQEWFSSSKRILFLLKDQHQDGEPKWDEDIRDWLKNTENDNGKALEQKRKNRNLEILFTQRLAYLLWGLSKADKNCDWWHDEITQHFEEVKTFFNTQPFALVECKKMPGGGSLDDNILKRHLSSYGDLLKKELDLLKPNIIICTSEHIYDFVISSCSEDSIQKLEGHNSIRIIRNNNHTETLIFCSYHPSVFGKKKDFFYEGVMYHYRAFLKSKFNDIGA